MGQFKVPARWLIRHGMVGRRMRTIGQPACKSDAGRWFARHGDHLDYGTPDKLIPRPACRYRPSIANSGDRDRHVTCRGWGDLALYRSGLSDCPHMRLARLGLYGTLLAPFNLETLFIIILPYAVISRGIGLIESLPDVELVSGFMTNTRGGASTGCIAQGVANTVTASLAVMGGCRDDRPVDIRQSGGRTTGCGDRCGRCPCCSLNLVGRTFD